MPEYWGLVCLGCVVFYKYIVLEERACRPNTGTNTKLTQSGLFFSLFRSSGAIREHDESDKFGISGSLGKFLCYTIFITYSIITDC